MGKADFLVQNLSSPEGIAEAIPKSAEFRFHIILLISPNFK